MKIYLSVVFLVLSTWAWSQKVINDPNVEPRSVGTFHAIEISNAFDVYLTQGSEEGLAVSASDKSAIEGIRTEVQNGVLKIWFDSKMKWQSRKLRAYISVKNLSRISASGANDVHIEGALSVPDLEIHLAGASDFEGTINVKNKLRADLNGACDLKISGSAEQAVITAAGASDVRAFDFRVASCTISATGATDVKVTVERELSAEISGASDVTYKGNAVIKDLKKSGSSSIRKS
ncbi:MAG TPA: head GIN domain-containing protein [Flavisolibacter sp.]